MNEPSLEQIVTANAAPHGGFRSAADLEAVAASARAEFGHLSRESQVRLIQGKLASGGYAKHLNPRATGAQPGNVAGPAPAGGARPYMGTPDARAGDQLLGGLAAAEQARRAGQGGFGLFGVHGAQPGSPAAPAPAPGAQAGDRLMNDLAAAEQARRAGQTGFGLFGVHKK